MGFLEDVDNNNGNENSTKENSQEVINVDASSVNAPEQADEGLIAPADLEDVADLYDKFEEIKNNLLDIGTDTTAIEGSQYINKSGWRKIATAFNVSVEIVEEEQWVESDVVKCRVRAVAEAPNGRTSSGVAMCASNESNHMKLLEGSVPMEDEMRGWSPDDENVLEVDGSFRRLRDPKAVNEHNIYATAETRAKNRAISDMVGGGEVSAEEITADDVL